MQLIFVIEYPKELDYLRLSRLSLRVKPSPTYHIGNMGTYGSYEVQV